MFSSVRTRGRARARARAARATLFATVALTSLAVVTTASASSLARVRSHVHRADVALQHALSGGVSGGGGGALPVMTSQLGFAGSLSTNLALHAKTPDVKRAATNALRLVARAEAKAEAELTNDLANVSASEESAVLTADLQVTQGQELALTALGRISAESGASAANLTAHISGLADTAKSLLADLVSRVSSAPADCASIGSYAQLIAAEIPSSVEATLNPLGTSVPRLASMVNAGGSLLGATVSQEVATTQTAVQTDTEVNCAPTAGTDTTSDGSVAVSGSAGVALNGSGSLGLSLPLGL